MLICFTIITNHFSEFERTPALPGKLILGLQKMLETAFLSVLPAR